MGIVFNNRCIGIGQVVPDVFDICGKAEVVDSQQCRSRFQFVVRHKLQIVVHMIENWNRIYGSD
jgi:hypothetical protein